MVYAASFFNDAIITELDINNFEMPIYSIERKKQWNTTGCTSIL